MEKKRSAITTITGFICLFIGLIAVALFSWGILATICVYYDSHNGYDATGLGIIFSLPAIIVGVIVSCITLPFTIGLILKPKQLILATAVFAMLPLAFIPQWMSWHTKIDQQHRENEKRKQEFEQGQRLNDQIVYEFKKANNLFSIGVGGPSGESRNLKIYLQRYCCPLTSLEVRAKEPVSENNSQWVHFYSFSISNQQDINSISGVEVCYEIKSNVPGQTYISQTRLTESGKPYAKDVQLNDETDQKEIGPKCYVAKGNFKPEGHVSLRLRVVFGNVDDSIIINSTKPLFN